MRYNGTAFTLRCATGYHSESVLVAISDIFVKFLCMYVCQTVLGSCSPVARFVRSKHSKNHVVRN